MSDIKSVIILLCKHLSLSVGSSLQPEHFRLAKYNKEDCVVTQTLWTTLRDLSRQAVKDTGIQIDFDRYDDAYATKLYLVLLEYPAIHFYALSPKDNTGSRELLLALGWLLATKNVSSTCVRAKLTSSIFAHEFSGDDDPVVQEKSSDNSQSSSDPKSQMRSIVHKCGRIGHNLKAIAELIDEKIKLTTKIHSATLNTSGLPHLSVSEVALTKKSSINNGKAFTKNDEKRVKELNTLARVLDTYIQWSKKQHIFYDWMVTVIEEKNSEENTNTEENSTSDDQCIELKKFLSLLRHVTKKKVHALQKTDTTPIYSEPCPSRLSRRPESNTEAELWTSQTEDQIKTVEIAVENTMKLLTVELKKMLKSIPNSVEI